MNFHTYAAMSPDEADFSPRSSLLSSVPVSTSSSKKSIRRAYCRVRASCHRLKVKMARPFRREPVDHEDTTCDEFELPSASPVTFDFDVNDVGPMSMNEDDWYTTLAITLRSGRPIYV